MEKEAQKVPADKQRRSKVYPRYGLEAVLAFVKTIEDAGGNRVPKATVADLTKIPSNSSGFLGRVSGAKQFGLITVENEKFSTTPRANRIFHEVSEDDRRTALVEAFSEPSLYKELIKKYNGKTLPPTPTLANILMNDPESGIEKNACASAASNFFQSAQHVGAIRGGMLVVSHAIESAHTDDEIKVTSATPSGQLMRIVPPFASSQQHHNSGTDFVFDFGGGVRLTVPKNTETSEAIADGELKQVRAEIKAFADKYLVKQEKELELP